MDFPPIAEIVEQYRVRGLFAERGVTYLQPVYGQPIACAMGVMAVMAGALDNDLLITGQPLTSLTADDARTFLGRKGYTSRQLEGVILGFDHAIDSDEEIEATISIYWDMAGIVFGRDVYRACRDEGLLSNRELEAL